VALLVALAAGVTVAVVAWPNTADPEKYASPVSREPAVVLETPESVTLGDHSRAAAVLTARRFLETAVLRRNVEDSWELVHPELRQGMTRAEWSTGDIPVTPYPVDSARWRLGYSHEREVGLEVYVLPKTGSEVRSMVFDLELKAAGRGSERRWLVSSWSPRGGTLFAAPPVPSERDAGERDAAARSDAARLPIAWLLLPLGFFAAVLCVPLLLGLRERRRRRVAERLSREHRDRWLAARQLPRG
jgi:hypothetical protein